MIQSGNPHVSEDPDNRVIMLMVMMVIQRLTVYSLHIFMEPTLSIAFTIEFLHETSSSTDAVRAHFGHQLNITAQGHEGFGQLLWASQWQKPTIWGGWFTRFTPIYRDFTVDGL